MADLNKKCGLTLSDNWEQVSVDQMTNDSKKGWISNKSCEEYDEEEDVSEDSFESDLGNEIEENYYDGGNDINNNINNMANQKELPSTPTSTSYNSKNSKLHVYEKVIYFMIAFIILAALIISLIKLNITFIIVMSVLLFFEAIFICIRLKYVKWISKNPVNIIALNEHDEFQKENGFNKEWCVHGKTNKETYDIDGNNVR